MNSTSRATVIAIFAAFLVGCAHRTIDIGTKVDIDKQTNQPVVVSERPSVVHIRDDRHDFDVLFGPSFGVAGATARLRVQSSALNVVLSGGWDYLTGQYPLGGTKT